MKRFAALIPASPHATRPVTSPYIDEAVLKIKSKTGINYDGERESCDGAVAQVVARNTGSQRFSLEGETLIENTGTDNNTDAVA